MAILIILAAITFTIHGGGPSDVVIDVSLHRGDPVVLDLRKIRQVFEMDKPDVTTPEHVVLAPVVLKEIPAAEVQESAVTMPAETLPFEVIPDTHQDFLEPRLSAFDVGLLNRSEAMGLGGQEHGPNGLNLNGTVRGYGNYGTLIQDLGGRIKDAAVPFNGNALLVWLLDTSVSMKDDQSAIRGQLWEMDRRFRGAEKASQLKQCVVAFDEKPRMVLSPTDDVDAVGKAFDQLESSPPGTQENVMAAVTYCATTFKAVKRARKILILVDDDSGDDSQNMEQAIRAVQDAEMTVYVINRESPFQQTEGYESYSYTDGQGDTYRGQGLVNRGPESVILEMPNLAWGSWNWPVNWGPSQQLSGFGVYDQNRLAFVTHGAYYILDAPGQGASQEADYDWDLLELYRPEIIAREAYLRRVTSNPYHRAIVEVERTWTDPALELHTKDWEPKLLLQNLERVQEKVQLADRLIRGMEQRVILPTDRLMKLESSRRWPAHADLVLAQLHLARYRLRQYGYALKEFQERVREVPADHCLVWQYNVRPRRTPEEASDRQSCVKAFQFVLERHPRTPWGAIAAKFDPESTQWLHGYSIRHRPYFKPYMALIDFKDGKRTEAKIVRIEREEVTYVTRYGTRTVPENTIAKITPIRKPLTSNCPRI